MKRLNTFAKLGLATTMAFGSFVPVMGMMTPIHAEEVQAGMVDTHNIQNLNIQLDGELQYTGDLLTQKVIIKDGNYVLQEDKDYKLEGNQNVEAGAYTLKVKGINDYHGEKDVVYVITRPSTEQVNVCNFNVELVNQLEDNGTDQVQQIKVMFGDEVVTEGVDYTVTGNVARNSGAYNLTIHGMGRFVGDLDVPYIVAGESHDQVNVCNFNVELVNELKDNGTDQVQQIKVMFGDKVVTEGVDYTVTGNVARNAGAYNLTIHGMGKFVGDLDVPYIVSGKSHDQVNIANTNIRLANTLTANGQAQTQKVEITCGDEVLKEGVDYTLENNVAKDAGTYTMTVNGKGQYVGSEKVNFTIAKATPEKKKDKTETGTQTNTGLFLGIGAFALASMAAAIAFLNKKKA